MIAISFVHPGILAGLGLASLPIIIHILNRRRFKVMDWAAMEFLLKAAVRNRRRVRLENLLLLLLRVLVVCLLIMAVSRPFTQRDNMLAGMFGNEGPTLRVILLDDSHSMHAGQGNRSAFDRARARVKKMVERLHEEGSKDTVTIVLGSDPRGADEGLTRVPIASGHAKKMQQRLDKLRVSDGTLDIPATVESLLEGVEDGSRVVLHIVSDFRRRDWTNPDGSLHPSVLQSLSKFSERGEVSLLDVGSPPANNVGVVELEPRGRAVIAGVPTTFVATVKNHGTEAADNVQVTFRFGEQVLLPVRIEGSIPPGDQKQVTRTFTFRADGPAVVQASVPSDVLEGDNIRRRVVDVRKTMRFLLVDGEPEHEDFRGETDFLAAALMPPGKVSSGIEVDPVSEHAFSGRELEAYDGVFLCNVYRLPADRVKRLEQFVKDGGGLVFFLGDQVDPSVYNLLFFGQGKEAGKGLLPLRLAEVEGSDGAYVHFNAPSVDHPVVRFLRGMNRIVFRTAAFSHFIRCDAPMAGTEARVVLTYTDDSTSPALAEKPFGDGRVLMFTSSADSEWSNFPKSILYLAMMQEAARYIVRPDPSGSTLVVGAPIVVDFDPTRMQRRAELVPAAELGGVALPLTLNEDPEDDERLFFRYERTTSAGVYTLKLTTPDGEPAKRLYAHNVDPTEGDLDRADVTKLVKAIPGARLERAGDDGALAEDEGDKSEFWRALVYALIAAAALETLLAWRFGHHKKKRQAGAGKQVFVR
jgi:hypothetical protein